MFALMLGVRFVGLLGKFVRIRAAEDTRSPAIGGATAATTAIPL